MPESDARVATVRPVAESEAFGKVAAIFADIKATKGIDFVPRLWRALATGIRRGGRLLQVAGESLPPS